MIDAFRKDFLRSEADWQTDGQTDGRNSAGIDSALKRFLLLFFFESTRTEGNSRRRSNKEPVENLAAILLHWRTPFPAVHHYLPRWYRFPTPSFPTDISSLVFSIPRLSLPFHLFLARLVQTRIRPLWIFRDVPHICFLLPTFSQNTSTRVDAHVTDQKRDRERWQ